MIRRHSLVWLTRPPDKSESPEMAASWQEAGNPFITCRTRPDEEISLGFCLPRLEGNPGSPLRIAAGTTSACVAKVLRPPTLAEVFSRLPLPGEFQDLLRSIPSECVVRLIGSRMWEVLTGVRYTTENSDLDLVVDLQKAEFASAVCDVLASICTPFRLDAELSFGLRGEVHWKEWFSGSDPILVKSIHEVRFLPRREFCSTES